MCRHDALAKCQPEPGAATGTVAGILALDAWRKAQAEGAFNAQALVQAGGSVPADSGFRQGRLVLAVANAGDDDKSYVLSATAAAYIHAPVPEAGRTAMFIAGLLLLGGVLVRRRQPTLA